MFFRKEGHLYFWGEALCLSEPGAGYVGPVVGQRAPDVCICFVNTEITDVRCHGQLFCLGSGDQTPVFMPALRTWTAISSDLSEP